MTGPDETWRRADLAALSRYARDKRRGDSARDLILGAVEEIASLRLRLDPASPAATAAGVGARLGKRTAEEHKAEAERLLDLAHHNHRAIATTETDADVAADHLRSVGLLLDAAQVHATLATIPDMVELVERTAEAPAGCMPGPTLAPGVRAYPLGWEHDPDLDVCAHTWELVSLAAGLADGLADPQVVRCSTCHVPRCGHSTDVDPCMERRHHRACHRYLSGQTEHVGGSAGTCGCSRPW